MKKTIFGFLTIVVVLSMIVGTCAAKAKKPIVLKAISFFPREDVPSLAAWRIFKDLVNEKAKGELIIQYAGGPEVIGSLEQPEAVRTGAMDIVTTSTSYSAPLCPAGLTNSVTRLNAIQLRENGYYDLIDQAFQKDMNARFFGWGERVPYNMFSSKPFYSPRELAGQRFRSISTYEPFYKKLGIRGVSMSMEELYTAAERGTVVGTTMSHSMMLIYKWYEVIKYQIGPNILVTECVMLMNLDKWNKLPKHLQDLMTKCQIESERRTLPYWEESVAKCKAALKEKGMEVIEWSPADTRYFVDEIVYPAVWEWIEGKVGKELTAKLKAKAG